MFTAAAGCVQVVPCLNALLLNPKSSSSSTSYLNFKFSPYSIITSSKSRIYSKSQQHRHVVDDMWEDPRDLEESEEEYLDVDDDSETDSVTSAAMSDSEIRFIQEVDQLLTPEERNILEENEAPVITKISTTKWGLLQTLALSQQIQFMDKMLVQGVPIDHPDKDGLTALHKAIIGKREAVISHLLRKGANPHVRDKDGAAPLHYAVQVGAMQTVKLLIKYKVDVNAQDNDGWTPLHVAIQSRCRDIAKVLLLNGADKTRRTKDGTSVLDLSLCYGKDFKSYDLVKLLKLVPAGIDP
ncbi:hypothetical protein ACHQM5_013942 [Ranunculus cassubicifolius]